VQIKQTASARLTLHTQPAVIPHTQAIYYELTIENLSGADWNPADSHPVQLSYHWLDERGSVVIYDGTRTPLPQPLRIGECCQAQLRVHPPALPGRYILEIDVVHEGVRWFDLGYRLPVECAPAVQPRAVLVNRNCVAGDAVGNNILRKLRLLEQWGYAPLLLTSYVDRRLPLADQARMLEVDAARLLNPPPDLQWAARQFWQASLYIFDYPEYYPLIELIRVAPRGSVVFDYHGVTPPELWVGDIARDSLELGVQNCRLVEYADYAIAHSEFTRDELLATRMIDPERVALLPYAVPIDAFHPYERKPALPELMPEDGPVLLYVGRMAGNKRIATLVRMTALVKKRYPDVRLLLVGDDDAPPYREVVVEVRRLIAELGLSANVIFTGPKRHDQLPAYYNACDVYVTSSLHEGFCIPVVEAMACGVPVVASRATALPSTIGDAGLLFDPEDVDMFAEHVLALLDSRM
jgi:glycosyltransferase involved in cell wall biosynthesis